MTRQRIAKRRALRPTLRRSGTSHPAARVKHPVASLNAKQQSVKRGSLDGLLCDVGKLPSSEEFLPAPSHLRVQIDLQRYLPMIAQIAFSFWAKLPAEYQAWIDVDDLIADGCICATRACARWDPARGAPITLIHIAVTNMLRNDVIGKFFTKKRFAPVVPVDLLRDSQLEPSIPADYASKLASRSAVEMLLSIASEDCRKFLADTLFSPSFRDLRKYSEDFIVQVLHEVSNLAKAVGVSDEDFRNVIAGKHENCIM